MTAIQLTKTWAINPNVRNSFTSLVDMAGWFIFENHAWLRSHGWTVKYTCDGTTGPTSGADHTDRLSSKTNAQTRGANATTAQSFTVLTSSDGVDLLITYQGATDDVIRISYSAGGLFTPAGTSNQQPTATDEVTISVGNSVINATTSADRVMSIWSTADGRAWSCALYRLGTLQNILGLERVVSACYPGVFAVPYIAYRYNAVDRSNSPGGSGPVYDASSTTAGTTGWFGTLARVFTGGAFRLTRLGGGTVAPADILGSSLTIEQSMLSNTPALQAGGMPTIPWFLTGEKAANLDGFLGVATDWWIGYGSSISQPATGDFFSGYEPTDNPNTDPERTNWLVAVGSTMIRPWRNAAASFQVT